MAPSAPPRFQASIESPDQVRERAAGVGLVARSSRPARRRDAAAATQNRSDVPVGVQPPTLEKA